MRVLITDSLSPVSLEMLTAAGLEPDVRLGLSTDELKTTAPGAQAWLIRSGTRITAELIEAATDLRVIGRAGVGVDNVDLESATRRGILVLNAPDGNTISTAEHTCAMILALARRIPAAHAATRSGRWERKQFGGAELDGKTLGIVGIGKIGRTVAGRMQAFGMRVVGHDPVLSAEAAERLGIELMDFPALCAEADFITVHTPLNDATRDLLNRESLGRCRPGVRIVNCARGGIANEQALLEALDSGQVAGAALDVFTQEPPGPELQALISHANVVVTPHIAASTDEAQEKVATQVVEGVIDALAGRPVATPVNAGAIRAAAQPEAQPFIALADRLGQLAAQITTGHIDRVVIQCVGDTARRYAEVLTVSALRGLMSHWIDEPVNLVNAPLLAREAGLQVEEQRISEPADFTNLVSLRIDGEHGSREVKGTVFGQGDVRLVEVDGFHVEVRLDGHLLFYRNVDRPGMVAAVGSLLSKHEINIASLALGRSAPGEVAASVFTVDEPIPKHVLEQIGAIDGVDQVYVAHLSP